MVDPKKQNQGSLAERLLRQISAKASAEKVEVIYGVYDSSRQSLTTRINDFLVDHSKVPLDEKAYFFQLLAVMVDAGIPVIQGIKMLATRSNNERFRRVLNTVAYVITQGRKFSEALARFPDVFSEMEIGVVKAGEAAGNMDKMLTRLAEQLSKSHELEVKLFSASIYPIVVLVVLTLAASGMLIWVVPSLVHLLEEGGLKEQDFPFATRFLIGLSSVLANYWWALIAGVAMIYLLLRVMVTTENGRYRLDLFKLKVPVVGTLLRKVLVLHFISILGILIESGLPVVQALSIVAGSLNNELYRLKVYEVISKVQQGQKISASLENTPFLFPQTIVQMLAVGEQSASIGLISNKIAKQYDMEIDYSLKRLMSLLEPLLIVFVGFTVAILALAILTPIFKLTQLI